MSRDGAGLADFEGGRMRLLAALLFAGRPKEVEVVMERSRETERREKDLVTKAQRLRGPRFISQLS